MTFDWLNYFKLAEELNRKKGVLADAEACQRSAISRAYYAAFHIAWEAAMDLDGFMVQDDNRKHEEVRKHFAFSTDEDRRQIGITLDRLRRNRNKSDYDDTVPGLDKLTDVSIVEADSCITEIKALK